MKKYILIAGITLPFICLLGWTLFLTVTRNTGKDIIVDITGYDPRDLLSGHYIAYQIDWENTDCTQFDDDVCPDEEFCKEAHWGRQCRFYIPENQAKDLDNLFARRSRNDLKFEVVYSYRKDRTPIAKKLLINGKDWQEYLRNKKL